MTKFFYSDDNTLGYDNGSLFFPKTAMAKVTQIFLQLFLCNQPRKYSMAFALKRFSDILQ